jgi:general secretion pathway protein A
LSALPFSIAPDPRFLYMSDGHREAMAHLLYGLREGGGFVQLTGEVGTGKTTLCRSLLSQVPEAIDVALIVNPKVDAAELLESICDELRIDHERGSSVKELLHRINHHLLNAHACGRRTVLVIDESQNLSTDVLEHVRLLTNLETEQAKLLQIILVGQSELKRTLERSDLRQLAQRITARYHLEPLNRRDTARYIARRLEVANCSRPLFTRAALRRVYSFSRGVPRLVNIISDRALLGAFARDRPEVTAAMVTAAGREVMGVGRRSPWRMLFAMTTAAAILVASPVAAWRMGWVPESLSARLEAVIQQVIGLSGRQEIGWNDGPRHESARATALVERAWADDPAVAPDAVMRTDIPPSAASRAAMLSRPLLEEVMSGRLATPSRVESLRRLTAIWGEDPSIVVDCVSVGEVGLRCLQGIGRWQALRRFERPFVVELRRDAATERFLVVRSVGRQTVEVELEGRRRRVSLDYIDPYWEGKFVLLWRPPPLVSYRIDAGSDRGDIRWLRRALNLASVLDGDLPLAEVDLPEFDDELRDRLHRFQRSHGLPEEDFAAEPELILLNSRLGLADVATLE